MASELPEILIREGKRRKKEKQKHDAN